jgi:hypothetical protein
MDHPQPRPSVIGARGSSGTLDRDRLAEKGRRLLDTHCAKGGRGSCFEGFAAHQLHLGHTDVVADLLEFLNRERCRLLTSNDPERFEVMKHLIAQIEKLLERNE